MIRSYGGGGTLLPRPARFLAFSHPGGDNSTRGRELGLHRNGSRGESKAGARWSVRSTCLSPRSPADAWHKTESPEGPWPAAWLEPVRRRVRRWCARGAGTAWVVAVSGGSDSVGLLRVLHALAPELGLTLSVAHLDHGARGEASRADAAFVEDLAGSLGLPFDLGRWQPTRAGHFEADARRARYDWLLATARARGATAVAVGHTLDDQAETILHRIVRGTGLRGLVGDARAAQARARGRAGGGAGPPAALGDACGTP